MARGGPQSPDAADASPSAAARDGAGTPSASDSSGWTTDEGASKPRASCVKHFDALWFCYCAARPA